MSVCVYSATSVPVSLFVPSIEEWEGGKKGWRAPEAEVLAPPTESDGSPRNSLQVIQSDDSSPEHRSMTSSDGWMWNGWMQLIWWEGKKKKAPKKTQNKTVESSSQWGIFPFFSLGGFSTESHEVERQGRITGLVTDRQTWKTVQKEGQMGARERKERPFGTT